MSFIDSDLLYIIYSKSLSIKDIYIIYMPFKAGLTVYIYKIGSKLNLCNTSVAVLDIYTYIFQY